MTKEVSRGQALQIAARVGTQVDWDKINGGFLQAEVIDLSPEEFGKRFTAFLKNGCRFIFGEPRTIKTRLFDPVEFLGKGNTIWRGSADGDGLSGEEDVCQQSRAIVEVELSKFVFRNCLKEDEISIIGEEKIRRINEMSDFIGFGLNVFLGLWEDYETNKENSALEWLHQNFGVTFMDFPGVILRSRSGRRHVLYLRRGADDKWYWERDQLSFQWCAGNPSVGCAS
ncbi:MAG: hypothetical protein WC238_06445 [Parcubacteria group bacterium]|jgi:hypothetical protein